MSEWVKLNANDGQVLSAYVARPQSEPIGALVLIQEIFGVNGYIFAESLTDMPQMGFWWWCRPCLIDMKRELI